MRRTYEKTNGVVNILMTGFGLLLRLSPHRYHPPLLLRLVPDGTMAARAW
jgi:hypothetical protein